MTRIALSLLVFVTISASAAHACSCAEPPTPTQALKDATAVFTGRLLDAEPDGANGFTYTLQVYAVWKGPSPGQIKVSTSDVAMCGLGMQSGASYLVYAGGTEGDLWTDNCTRSTPLQFAGADLAELGEPITVPVGDTALSVLKARYDQDR